MQQGALTYKYAWHLNVVILLGHGTNKIHISTCRRCINKTIGKVLTVLEAPKHDPLIKWPTWDHATIWKIYISIFMRFIDNKLGRLLTLVRIFVTQTLKSSPTSCLLFFIYYMLITSYLYQTIHSFPNKLNSPSSKFRKCFEYDSEDKAVSSFFFNA